MSFNSHVLVWWLEQIIAYIGLIVCTILCIIVIKALRSHKLAPTLRFLIYTLHILSVLFFIVTILSLIILPLFRSLQIPINPIIACQTIYILLSSLGAGLLLVVINVFFERLRLSFVDTDLAISSVCHFLFRILLTFMWAALGSIYLYVADPTPFNIYSQRVDILNGITCSTHAKGRDNSMTLIYSIAACTMIVSNLIVLFLFISKLYTLLKQMAAKTDNASEVSADFIAIMKDQTMLVSIAVVSTAILWSLEAALQIGQTFASMDIIVNVSVCFLTFRFNKKYFNFCKCDLLALFCCKWFETVIATEHSTIIELKLAKSISTSDMLNIADFTVAAKSTTDTAPSIATSVTSQSPTSSLQSKQASIAIGVTLQK